MIKILAFVGILTFSSNWIHTFGVPQLVAGPANYILMPLLGYVPIILFAQATNMFTKKAGAPE